MRISRRSGSNAAFGGDLDMVGGPVAALSGSLWACPVGRHGGCCLTASGSY